MGIIKRQSLKNSVVNYVGLGIGAISTLWIYTRDTETYGIAQFLLKMAALLVPLATLGVISLTIRFFPIFKDKYKTPAPFLGFLLAILAITLPLFYGLTWVFEEQLYDLLTKLNFKVEIYEAYGRYGFILCILLSLILFFDTYTRNYNRIVVQALLTNLLPKVALPLFFLLWFFQLLNLEQFVQSILLYHLVILAGLVIYLRHLGGLKIQWPRPRPDAQQLWQMATYAGFGILGTLGNSLALQVDAIMVPSLIDFRSNGIYFIAAFIAGAIEIPYKAINSIAAPAIAKAWKEDDQTEIKSVYRKSSNTLVAVGLLLFVLIWISLDDLFLLTPRADELMEGKYVVLFLGLAKVVDMFTSVNGSIILFSRYFRFMLLALLSMAVMNVWLNFALIPIYSLVGPAIATLISMICFNLMKLIFIWIKFKMHPFTWESLSLIITAGLVLLLGIWMPVTTYPLINIFLRSSVIGFLFILIIFYFNFAPDLTNLGMESLKRVRDIFRKEQ